MGFIPGKRGDNMFLGLDVGGTFTDGVVVADGKIVSMVKAPTTNENLLRCILTVVDKMVEDIGSKAFERIVLSTTIVTNAIVEGKIDQVALCIMPGPGMNIADILPVEPYILSGYIDHRGREMAQPSKEEVLSACRHFASCDVFVVSGKFAVRNPNFESAVADWIQEKVSPMHISRGGKVSGTLNFLRRTNSAYYNAAVWRRFNAFATAVEEALTIRGVYSPVFVLKADGGTLPLSVARNCPIEAIFTGPAASTIGVMGMNGDAAVSGISLDIGGTTTDIALWQKGRPALAKEGAAVAGHRTGVQGFRLKSAGIGGDSLVFWENHVLKVGPMRHGPAMAAGGPKPTVTDAMVAAGFIDFGDRALAVKAMKQLALQGQSPEEMASQVVDKAVNDICQAIADLLDEQAAEPLYHVEEIVYERKFVLETIIGVGGGAAGLVPLIAKKLGISYTLPENGKVANAFGAAVARPTIAITLRADTAEGYYTVPELGIKNRLPRGNSSLQNMYELAEKHLAELAQRNSIFAGETQIVQSEEFNMVRGFTSVGKIMTCRLQIKPGVLQYGEEELC
ncbi:N-methylhydantoinase A/oxoprolinase/acetone carboxylase, beta subunit [Pelosinus propionicus DSM 13327]|uniref:N-methylhydantoinase A/oxoprolinase/acetone carboxylase, beta subunit n=1 Tax=Pelosinus propionicus DSM 13327 TaxID=1123291 RepID=A0A1I4JG69_9FIRM|nr:N-methylhydantoinase A/oxoprolinase/acetone carboxylase, beta subunit [Pelosinus propionicus DSM 13327]